MDEAPVSESCHLLFAVASPRLGRHEVKGADSKLLLLPKIFFRLPIKVNSGELVGIRA